MGKEIERKFLVNGDSWREGAGGTLYRQGYLCAAKEKSVRVRIGGDKAFLTVKGESCGATRTEFEYEIPVADANILLDELCEKPLIEKVRYKIVVRGDTWEVDEFFGQNEGLIVAEIELEDETRCPEKPEWVGAEVTDDPRYYNVNLVNNPYSKWREK